MKYWIELEINLLKIRLFSRVSGFTLLNFSFYYHSYYPGKIGFSGNANKEVIGFDYVFSNHTGIALFFIVPIVFRKIRPHERHS